MLGLFGAWRSLGAAPVAVADSGALLRSLQRSLRGSVDELLAFVAADGGPFDLDAEAARRARRVSAAVQQSLDRLPSRGELTGDQAGAGELLAAAAEDVNWGWRMLQAGGASPGVKAASATLAAHASDCCDQALALLADVATGEPRNGL